MEHKVVVFVVCFLNAASRSLMSNTVLYLAAPQRPRFILSAFVKTDKNETVTPSASKAAAALMCWVNTLVTQPVLVLFHGRLSLILRGDQRVCGRARLDIPAVGAAERRRRYNKPALGTLSARLLLLPHLFEDAIGCEIGGRSPSSNILSLSCPACRRSDSPTPPYLHHCSRRFFFIFFLG